MDASADRCQNQRANTWTMQVLEEAISSLVEPNLVSLNIEHCCRHETARPSQVVRVCRILDLDVVYCIIEILRNALEG